MLCEVQLRQEEQTTQALCCKTGRAARDDRAHRSARQQIWALHAHSHVCPCNGESLIQVNRLEQAA